MSAPANKPRKLVLNPTNVTEMAGETPSIFYHARKDSGDRHTLKANDISLPLDKRVQHATNAVQSYKTEFATRKKVDKILGDANHAKYTAEVAKPRTTAANQLKMKLSAAEHGARMSVWKKTP